MHDFESQTVQHCFHNVNIFDFIEHEECLTHYIRSENYIFGEDSSYLVIVEVLIEL